MRPPNKCRLCRREFGYPVHFCKRCAECLRQSWRCPTPGFHTRFIAICLMTEDVAGFIDGFYHMVAPERIASGVKEV